MSGDGMDHLRIPFEKIEFGRKLEVQGYGTIYEGELDGRKVALKQLNITNLVNVKPRLLAEILAISRFREHPNVVALLGFCDEKSNEIILVHEYVGSGNLADKMRKRLNTIQRLEICLGAARGLDYLHTGVDDESSTPVSIVHGNIKPSKILLNSNSTGFDAKVSSFGLSKVVPGQSRKNLEPVEPATKESDVYSFGVLLLEVLCGVSELVDTDDYQERHVSELVPKRLEQNKLRNVVHFDIRKEIKEPALETYAKIACECVNESPEARPTMARVVEELEKALILQGGVVSPVHIPSSINVVTAPNETVGEAGPKEEDNGVTVYSNVPKNMKDPTIDQGANDLVSDYRFAREYNSDTIASETTGVEVSDVYILGGSNGNGLIEGTTDDHDQEGDGTGETMSSYIAEDDSKVTEETVGITARGIAAPNESQTFVLMQENGSSGVPISDVIDAESIHETTHIIDALEESSNDVLMSTNDREITKDVVDGLVSSDKSITNGEHEDGNECTGLATSSEDSNGYPYRTTQCSIL